MATVITGGNRGIGQALAQALRDAGQEVIATARDGSTGATLDVADPASVTAFAASLGDRPVSALVCNAGVYLDKGAQIGGGYSPELWAQTFAVNVTGVFLTIEALLPHLRRTGNAKIMIISSQMGSSAKAKGNALIYRSSKAAVLNLGLNLATALRPEGIAVGIYHPGWARTEMGGAAADISQEEAAQGLAARLAALSPETTGCFETWDGRPHPI